MRKFRSETDGRICRALAGIWRGRNQLISPHFTPFFAKKSRPARKVHSPNMEKIRARELSA
ncbi:MAG: hypothetical protein DMG57_31725 [Acidobacteria bacterium]|nr:MAG: hypothetical protein DMG57_31725 [Acidobacteriota bacterium]